MKEMELGIVESQFAQIVWDNEPLSSGELVKLCERGFFENRNATVISLISREEYGSLRPEKFVEDAFEGSLPALSLIPSTEIISEDEFADMLE